MLRTSYVDDCLAWPGDAVRAPFTGPLPDVPALLLGGRLDTRTPVENALRHARRGCRTRRRRPQGLRPRRTRQRHHRLLGAGAEALHRDVPVGHPCVGTNNGVAPTPLPPRSLSDFRSAPGVGGARGRALFAVLDTVTDARLAALQTLFAGLQVRGGGLRGGSFSARPASRAVCVCAATPSCPACVSAARWSHQRGLDLGHRARQRDRERHPEDRWPRWRGHRHARRPSRALPPDATGGVGHAARRRLAVAARLRAAAPAHRARSLAAAWPRPLGPGAIPAVVTALVARPRAMAVAGALTIAFSAILVKQAGVSPSTAAIFRCAYALPVLGVLAWRGGPALRPARRGASGGWRRSPASSSPST